MRLRRGRLCPTCFPAQTPSLPFGTVIICAVLAALSAVTHPRIPMRKAGRAAAGSQIITLEVIASAEARRSVKVPDVVLRLCYM